MTLNHEPPATRRKKKLASAVQQNQLGLFDDPPPPALSPPPPAPPLPPKAKNAPPTAGAKVRATVQRRDEPIVVSIEDMPQYPLDQQEAVDRLLAELKNDHLLMTYRSIKECFGISRATVARRVKEGLVPGTRFLHGRVLDEGPVRRFDRTQVRWLLLSVRSSRNR